MATMVPRSAPFDSVADSYDELFTASHIGSAQRSAVRTEMDRVFHTGQHILELNCGTGVDALHLASRGIRVDAFDSSRCMIQVARRKVSAHAPVRFDVLEIEQLSRIRGPYDGVLSNFGGLNCVEDIGSVADELARLVSPGGTALLCLCNRTCAWEVGWYLARRQPSKAFRRWRSGRLAHIGESEVEVWYPSIRELRGAFAPAFRLRQWKGIGLAVPPSYVEHLARRHSGLLSAAVVSDRVLSRVPLIRAAADHILLEFVRREPHA